MKELHTQTSVIISLAGFPFALKILWASFLDKYFIKSFGKRKTYIVPCKYLVGVIYLIYSYYFDADIDNLNITPIAIVMLLIITLEATADIAIDGWVLTILSEENVVLGPTCQAAGQGLGLFVSQFLFVQLTSTRFANTYIYSEPSSEPLMSYGTYLRFWGVFTLIIAFMIHFFKKEVNPESREFSSVWEVYKTLKGFYTNKNLRFLCFIWLVRRAGFVFMGQAGSLELVKKGFPKETLTNIGIITYPLMLIGPIWVAKYALLRMELQTLFRGIIVQVVYVLGMMLIISMYDELAEDGLSVMIMLMSFIGIVANVMMDGLLSSFNTRICDPNVGGTFITALASILNFSETIITPVGLSILGHVSFNLANLVGVSYQLWFRYKFVDRCIELQKAPKEIWSLYYEGEPAGYTEMKDGGSFNRKSNEE